MKKFLAYVMITVMFASLFGFAIAQIYIFEKLGFIWGILTWVPFMGWFWLLSKVLPEDYYH